MKSAARALDILELLAQQPVPLEAATIARLCGIPRSSTYQLLNTLTARGLLVTDDRRWSPSARLAEIGSDAPSIHEIMRVLDSFRRGSERVGGAELARRTALHVATVDRILPLLVAETLLAVHDDGTYSLGLRVAMLSGRFTGIEQLRSAARPVLSSLREQTGETANLLVRDGAHAVYLEQAESERNLRHAPWLGRRIPLDMSASGRALTDGGGPWTVRDAVEEGVTAVACAVEGAPELAAAISVTGPTVRLRGSLLKTTQAMVRAASIEVSTRRRALG